MATVLLHGIQYGTGAGSSHKIAKQYAAKSTFDILIPSAENRIKVDRQFELPERQDRKIEGNTVSNCCLHGNIIDVVSI